MADTAVNFWPKGATMLDRVIVKDWGLMLPVRHYELSGERTGGAMFSAIAFTGKNGEGSTSIHRHSCGSRILVVRGHLLVETAESEVALGPGDSVVIPPDVWHQIHFMEDDTLAVEDYSHVGDTYPIERHEGEDWPDE